jgi:hypothetical protein
MPKRFWAMTIKKTLLSLLIVFLAGVAFDYFSNEPDYRSPWTTGVVSIVLYFVATLIILLLNLVTNLLYMWLFLDKELSAAIVEDLHNAKILPPRSQDSKNRHYLAELADDEEAPVPDRVRAAVLHGSYANAMSSGLFRAVSLQRAIDNAVLRYYQEAPQRN